MSRVTLPGIYHKHEELTDQQSRPQIMLCRCAKKILVLPGVILPCTQRPQHRRQVQIP